MKFPVLEFVLLPTALLLHYVAGQCKTEENAAALCFLTEMEYEQAMECNDCVQLVVDKITNTSVEAIINETLGDLDIPDLDDLPEDLPEDAPNFTIPTDIICAVISNWLCDEFYSICGDNTCGSCEDEVVSGYLCRSADRAPECDTLPRCSGATTLSSSLTTLVMTAVAIVVVMAISSF